MERTVKVMLAEKGSDFGKNCAAALEKVGYDVIFAPKDGNAVLDAFEKEKPEVLLMDAFMSNTDALGVLKKLKGEDKPSDCLVMVISSVDNRVFEDEILAAGADYYFLKPFDVNMMATRIKQLVERKKTNSDGIITPNYNLQVMVSDIMHQIGVPAHIKGYQYLREAIILSIDDREMMNSVTKLLYPTVAKK